MRVGGQLSSAFTIGNGVKQGCVLAPTLFSIFFDAMLNHASEHMSETDNIVIRSRPSGSLFDLSRLNAHTKTTVTIVRELLFADDAAMVAHSERTLQHLTTCLDRATGNFGMDVSKEKTVVLHQAATENSNDPNPSIYVKDYKLAIVDNFKYLGSTIAADARLDKEIESRLSKANKAFGRLTKRVWKNKNLKKHTKVKVYRAVVLPTLLYGAETWVTYRRHIRTLERFHQRCLRSILKVHWQDHITNQEILIRAKVLSIEGHLQKSLLRWSGHVSRMEDSRLPKIALFGKLASGKRRQGAPSKTYRQSLKQTLTKCKINHRNWHTLASDRQNWRYIISKTTSQAELERNKRAAEKRLRRKTRHIAPSNPN